MLEIVLEASSMFFPILLYWVRRSHRLKPDTSFRLMTVYLAGLGFSFGWEPVGTGYAWSYPNFNFYIVDGIPIAILLGWPFLLVSRYQIKELLVTRLRSKGRTLNYSVMFAMGMAVGTFVEITGVALGWWRYLQPLPRSWSIYAFSGYIHVITFIGWGIIAVLILALSDNFHRRMMVRSFKVPIITFVLSIFSGTGLYFALGILYLVLPWSR